MNPSLYLLVSLSGACVLSLEILGTRVLGPYYGVSIYLWSALITITLAALSLGYSLGGRLADRGPRAGRLAWMFGGAGVWVLLVPWLKYPLLGLAEGAGLRGAVLVSATVLFAPPLTLLGMVGPYAIRLKADRLSEVGRTAGDLFAVSTIASVVSAVATGFWLVPALGVSNLLAVIGALLLAGAAFALLLDRRHARTVGAAAILLAAAGVGLLNPAQQRSKGSGLVELVDSPYAEIRVVDRADGRYLLIDGGVHSILGFGVGESEHRYVPVIESMTLLFEQPGETLLLGLGGGSLATAYRDSGWAVESVEIDPVVARVAREHFSLPRQIPVHVADARRFLRSDARRWDLIVVDTFGSSSIPFHLVTREMFALVADRLTPAGMVAMNVEARAWDDPFVHALGVTLAQSFRSVWALPTAEPPNTLGNVVMVATNRDGFGFPEGALEHPFDAVARGDDEYHWRVVQQNHAWDNRYVPGERGGIVLTDDRSPVDLWAEAINRSARRGLHEFFGEDERVY